MNEKTTQKENQKYCLFCGAIVTLDPDEDQNYSIGEIPICTLSCRTLYQKGEKRTVQGWRLQGLIPIFLVRSAEDYDFSHLLYQQQQPQESATA